MNETFPHQSTTEKCTDNNWNSHFTSFLSFFMAIFVISKFHDISMTWKATVISPGFQGFPDTVGIL